MAESPWVADDLAAIPALAAVLRAGLLSKVRTFEVYCERGSHRCVQVLVIDGRPLALGKQLSMGGVLHAGPDAPPSVTTYYHRGVTRAVWLDVAPARVPVGAECRCGDQLVLAGWLNEQLAAGRTRRVLDAATRREIIERGRTYPPL